MGINLKLSAKDIKIFFENIFKDSEPNSKLRDARDMYANATSEFNEPKVVWPILNKDQTQKAIDFYMRHIELIKAETSEHIGIYPPSYEDINEPMLWKFEHWAWFMRAYDLFE